MTLRKSSEKMEIDKYPARDRLDDLCGCCGSCGCCAIEEMISSILLYCLSIKVLTDCSLRKQELHDYMVDSITSRCSSRVNE